MDPDQRRRAERRLLATLRRLHRSEPLQAGIRIDTLIERVRLDAGAPRPASHRGASPLTADEGELRDVVDEMAKRGELVRTGRRVRLPGHRTELGAVMQERVERLLAELRFAGWMPPRVDTLAARIGIPAGVLEHLRRAGVLVAVAPGIDYPSDVAAAVDARIRLLAAGGSLGVAQLRDELAISRRYAAALLDWHRASDGGAEPS